MVSRAQAESSDGPHIKKQFAPKDKRKTCTEEYLME